MGHLDDNRVIDLLQGALTPEGLARVHEHIGKCTACREVVAEAARTSTAKAPDPKVPPAKASEPVRIVIRDGKVSRKKIPFTAGRPASFGLDLASGMVIGERYRLERMLGEGGSGVVWAATHTMMKREVALKFLKATKPEAVKRFLREARITSGLRHPNIVAVHDLFILPETETPVMVMDFLSGQSLGARLRAVKRLAPDETARLLMPAVQALGAAHTLGIVHRDLKPENIFLVGADGAVDSVCVLDFGLAKLTANEGPMTTTSRITRSGVVIGTPHYLAPEQLSPEVPVDHAVDVWALGVVLYECLAGLRPFEGRGLPQLFREITTATPVPLPELVEGVPLPLALLVARMLDKAPAARPQLLEICDVLTGVAAP